MPTYDYVCTKCGHKLEVFHKMSDEPVKVCPKCGESTLQKRPGGGIGLSFSGGGAGFYANDYKSKSADSDTPPPKASKSECCPCGKPNSCSS